MIMNDGGGDDDCHELVVVLVCFASAGGRVPQNYNFYRSP